MEYRYQKQPGCGGCLFMVVLLVLLTGGMPMLLDLLGALFYVALTFIFLMVLAFWGFSYFIRRQVANYERSQTETHNRFVFLLVNILVNIAALDGEVSREEINAINNFFRSNLLYNQSQMYWVKEMIKEATATSPVLDELLADFKANFAYEPRLILLELIYQVIYSKPRIIEAELAAAENIGIYLDINIYHRQAIHGKYVGGARQQAATEENYYGVLGLEPGASAEEVKNSYRRLSKEYHPDKVAHLGEEFRRIAEEKMKEINVAYNHLKKKFS